jgi:hypothetical protein
LKHFFDSQGRLFSNEKIILDDGILQPCQILKSSKYLFLLKHSSIYIFDSKNNDEFITRLRHDHLITGAAEMDFNDNLLVCTDRGIILTLEGLELKFNKIKMKQESDDENDEDFEFGDSSDQEISPNSESISIFNLIRNPNYPEILIFKLDSFHKKAWIDQIPISSSHLKIKKSLSPPLPNFNITAHIVCPLCNESQNLLLNSNSCLNGHPITICSLTKQLITTKCYKCRGCNCAFITNPKSCPYCRGLITK